jgi:hypothetical protein
VKKPRPLANSVTKDTEARQLNERPADPPVDAKDFRNVALLHHTQKIQPTDSKRQPQRYSKKSAAQAPRAGFQSNLMPPPQHPIKLEENHEQSSTNELHQLREELETMRNEQNRLREENGRLQSSTSEQHSLIVEYRSQIANLEAALALEQQQKDELTTQALHNNQARLRCTVLEQKLISRIALFDLQYKELKSIHDFNLARLKERIRNGQFTDDEPSIIEQANSLHGEARVQFSQLDAYQMDLEQNKQELRPTIKSMERLLVEVYTKLEALRRLCTN